MKLSRLLFILPSLGCAVADAQPVQEEFHNEWPHFRYLQPKQVPELPAAIRADLERRNCLVPKFTKWDGHHNAIRGQFIRTGQLDWAVLCADAGKTIILLYPSGVAEGVLPLRSEDNDPHRFIHTVTAFVLAKRAARDQQGDEQLPVFDHDAIEDGSIQQSGRVIYFRDGEWTLQ